MSKIPSDVKHLCLTLSLKHSSPTNLTKLKLKLSMIRYSKHGAIVRTHVKLVRVSNIYTLQYLAKNATPTIGLEIRSIFNSTMTQYEPVSRNQPRNYT